MSRDAFAVLCTEAAACNVTVRVDLIRTIEGAQNLLRIELWRCGTRVDKGSPVPAGRDIDVQAWLLLGRLRRHLAEGETA